MSKLIITRGLPASGKTTYARAWVAEDPVARARVNRDDLRASLFGAMEKTRLDHAGEQAVTAAQRAMVRALLESGRDVIVDDTNLRLRFARAWADLAAELGADFEVLDQFLAVLLETCVIRDGYREDAVGRKVIQDMHARYLASTGGKLGPVTPTASTLPVVEPYQRPAEELGLPETWLVDIDGTLADMTRSGRGPYDWHRVGEDDPVESVLALVEALSERFRIVVMSGREDVCRDATLEWLATHGVGHDALLMRAAGDGRPDYVVKAELFDRHVAGHYDVLGVVDDRDSVVRMWRAKGLTCAQVAEGNF